MDRGAALAVDHQKLPEVDVGPTRGDRLQGLGGREARLKLVQHQRTERRVGDVLARDRPHPRPDMRAAGGDGGGGRRDGHAELPGPGAAGDDGEGHLSSSGMTAVPSISTSQEGRASAVTTTPVETGCTPLMYSPMVR